MKVKEMIEELERMNPEQDVVVAIEETKDSGNVATEYIGIDSIAQIPKFVVLEITLP